MTLQKTQMTIMLTMLVGLFICSAMSIYQWNDIISAAIILGFIASAQILVEDVFDEFGADKEHCYVAGVAGIFYVILVIMALQKWNIPISAQVGTGFAVFLLKIAREYVKAQAIIVANQKMKINNGETK